MDDENSGLPPEILQRLHEEYQKQLPKRLKKIGDAIQTLRKEPNRENLAAFRFLVHKMAGNAGSFGYSKVSELCKSWDTRVARIENNYSVSDMDKSFFSELDVFFQTIQKQFQIYEK